MSDFYRGKRTKASSYYQPGQAFRLSRSNIDLFFECPRCLYIDRRLGVGRPPGFPFTLNSRVDGQLKALFDSARDAGTYPAVLAGTGLRPAPDARLDTWRNNFKGVTREYGNLTVFGAIDDLWENDAGLFAPADYKATATKEVVEAIEPETKGHHKSYVRQMEIYAWLLASHLGADTMSGKGHWLYVTATGKDSEGKQIVGPDLHFESRIITRELDTSWVEPTLDAIIACLDGATIPAPGDDCDVCLHHRLVAEELRERA